MGPFIIISWTAIIIAFAIFLIRKNKADRARQAAFQAERAKYLPEYEGKSAEKLAGMPYYTEIGPDGLPKTPGADGWGTKYTFYMAPCGHVFHRDPTCSHASIPVHACNVTHLRPCRLCGPCLPELSWWDRYKKIKAIKEKYKID